MLIHCQPIIYTVRVYEEGKSYDKHDDYIGVCTVQMLGDKTAWISGLASKLPQSVAGKMIMTQLLDWLHNQGIMEARWDEDGKIIVKSTSRIFSKNHKENIHPLF